MEEIKEKMLQEEKSAEEAAEAMRETMEDTADIVRENAEKAEKKVTESMEEVAESTDKVLERTEQALNTSAEPQKKQKVPFGQKVKNAFSPKNLVKTDGDRTYVQVFENGEKQDRDVVTGISNATEIEIVSGVEAGEAVIIR